MAAQVPGITGRIFSVTGGVSGMGLATVLLLAKQGAAQIFVADWNIDNGSKLVADAAAINPATKVHIAKVDVSDSKQVDAWVSSIVSATGGLLHGAANVAGIAQGVLSATPPTLLKQDDASWERVLGVNLNGIMYCTRAQVREMTKMAPGSNQSIVNVSSMASLVTTSANYAYTVSKGACAHFTGCVAKDVATLGIRANTVSPGPTKTPMSPAFIAGLNEEEVKTLVASLGFTGAVMEADDIARSIVMLLSEQSAGINGVNLPVGSGIP